MVRNWMRILVLLGALPTTGLFGQAQTLHRGSSLDQTL